ncbi:hypothetical protein AVEN_256916-1 [Araneus ventricosus]|uniref:Uncharacterized protein n=1 Tax=Araneus ventricosus TaxID=182803 RepID=A0A4Y2CHE8_ARAVE|nr:hypothetical protein AVEN_256916-1 [Araneus ventricosus]
MPEEIIFLVSRISIDLFFSLDGRYSPFLSCSRHLINSLKNTSSLKGISDAIRSGRLKIATDEGTSTQVLAAMARSPTKGTQHLSAQMRISQSSVMRIQAADVTASDRG